MYFNATSTDLQKKLVGRDKILVTSPSNLDRIFLLCIFLLSLRNPIEWPHITFSLVDPKAFNYLILPLATQMSKEILSRFPASEETTKQWIC